jgi:hypothetical protein
MDANVFVYFINYEFFFQLKFLKEEKCATVCRKTYNGDNEEDEKKLQLLRTGMQLSYQHHWIVGEI